MTTPAHAGRMLFVNMPVADIERSKAFFAQLGFSYHPMFTDETAARMRRCAVRTRSRVTHQMSVGGATVWTWCSGS